MLEGDNGVVYQCRTYPEEEPSAEAPGPAGSAQLILIDEDGHYREALEVELGDEGFAVHSFGDKQSMLTAVADGLRADVIVLNWDSNGIGELGDLAARLNGPIVIMSDRNYPVLEKWALERGAADFIDKARGSGVLAARLRRLVTQNRTAPKSVPSKETVTYGRLTLRPATNRAYWDDVDVNLTMAEFKVVSLLVSNAGSFVTYRQIYDCMRYQGFISGHGEDGYRANVRSGIRRVRSKFKAVCGDFNEIQNFQSLGYRWVE
jgi:two-component system response regulator ChvI